MPSRLDTLRAAADALDHAPTFSAFVGFDGFIDLILRPVATRRSMAPDDFTPVRTMTEFADRVKAAAGKSTNIETVLHEARFGGNGPLMAGALANLGLAITYAGSVGTADPLSPLDPVFVPFAQRCRRVVTLGPPSTTACYEFDDGKLMLNDRTNVQRVTREVLLKAFGLPGLLECLAPCRLLGLLNWSLMGGVADLLRFFTAELLPKLPPHAEPRRVFIDLADPTPRSREDLLGALLTLRDMNRVPAVKVTLGLNLMEAEFVAAALELNVFKSDDRTPNTVSEAAKQLRAAIDVDTVVIHPREGAAASTASEHSVWFDGPFCDKPKLSTGAGDHFNAGFAFAQTLGFPLDQSLALATATSGLYVREAESPTPKSLSAFLRSLT
jgi:hypothetical protein